MSGRRITALRLTAFKSFRDAVLPLEAVTVLIGRNGSGKSNALEALGLLSRMARGEDLRDVTDGDRRGPEPVRGGLEGCTPPNGDSLTLGVTVTTQDGSHVDLDVTVDVASHPRIASERLVATVDGHRHVLLETLSEDETEHPDLALASVWTASQQARSTHRFRARYLLTHQLLTRLDGDTPEDRRVMALVSDLLQLLGGTLSLNPLPHEMRQYVSESDTTLRGSASNISAVVADLKAASPRRFRQLCQVIRQLPEYQVGNLKVTRTELRDVMVAVAEHFGDSMRLTSARQLSGGMLRVLAIATALITGGDDPQRTLFSGSDKDITLLAIEELENGLHPSQASSLLRLVFEETSRSGFQVVLATHSPALLDALAGDQHRGVVVVERDPASGRSTLSRLSDLPGYLRMMVGTTLGRAVTGGQVAEAARPAPAMDPRSIDEILGIG